MDNVKMSDIAKFLGAKLSGPDDCVDGVSSIKEYRLGTLTFSNTLPEIAGFNLICDYDDTVVIPTPNTIICHHHPKLAMIKVINEFFPPTNCHPVLGKNVNINDLSIIGKEGFNYVEDKGVLVQFPHVGGVRIGNNVDIGSCVCIDRGTLGDTIIGSGTKIDNLVHIAHNVKIGKNCLIIAGAILCGSCEIGNNVRIAPGAIIKEHVKVGDNAIIGLGAVVLKNVPDGQTWIGLPAKELKI